MNEREDNRVEVRGEKRKGKEERLRMHKREVYI
jgi:hypothetical protein